MWNEGARFMRGSQWDQGTVTTHRGMQAAQEAGWRHSVLDVGKGPTRRGSELLEYMQANC